MDVNALSFALLKNVVKTSNVNRSVFICNQIQRLLVFTKILVLPWLDEMQRVGQWLRVNIETSVSIASI